MIIIIFIETHNLKHELYLSCRKEFVRVEFLSYPILPKGYHMHVIKTQFFYFFMFLRSL